MRYSRYITEGVIPDVSKNSEKRLATNLSEAFTIRYCRQIERPIQNVLECMLITGVVGSFSRDSDNNFIVEGVVDLPSVLRYLPKHAQINEDTETPEIYWDIIEASYTTPEPAEDDYSIEDNLSQRQVESDVEQAYGRYVKYADELYQTWMNDTPDREKKYESYLGSLSGRDLDIVAFIDLYNQLETQSLSNYFGSRYGLSYDTVRSLIQNANGGSAKEMVVALDKFRKTYKHAEEEAEKEGADTVQAEDIWKLYEDDFTTLQDKISMYSDGVKKELIKQFDENKAVQ